MKRTTLDFDELNILDSKSVNKRRSKAIPYRDFFGRMFITPEQMNERIDLANKIEDVMLYVFAYWIIAQDADIPIDEIKQDAIDKLTNVIASKTTIDTYLQKHIVDVINEVVDATERHAKKAEDSDEEGDIEDFLEDSENEAERNARKIAKEEAEETSDYWTSRDRAVTISENEANAFDNYIEYREAVKQGKTKKTWITELDDKVRLTHTLMEGQTVDIDGLFFVGDSLMRFPMDTIFNASPQETINCRCACRYE